MRQVRLFGWILGSAAFGATLAGCAHVPPLDNPALIRPGDSDAENPILVAPGMPTPEGLAEVYGRVLDALDDYFEVKPSSRYSGVIETLPRPAPGYEQFWKPSTPDIRARIKATAQTMRQHARVTIESGERGGFRVTVEVFNEIEVLPTPIGAPVATPLFRDAPTMNRRSEVVASPRSAEPQWIPAGPAPHRDFAMEQVILRKIQRSGGVR